MKSRHWNSLINVVIGRKCDTQEHLELIWSLHAALLAGPCHIRQIEKERGADVSRWFDHWFHLETPLYSFPIFDSFVGPDEFTLDRLARQRRATTMNQEITPTSYDAAEDWCQEVTSSNNDILYHPKDFHKTLQQTAQELDFPVSVSHYLIYIYSLQQHFASLYFVGSSHKS